MAGYPPLPRSPSPIVSDFEVDTTPTKGPEPPHSPVDAVMAQIPAQKPKGRVKPLSNSSSELVELSVFDILNIFHRRWFLSRSHLLANVISAQKAEDGNISWVEFSSPYHAHLVKCAIALMPHPEPRVKVMTHPVPVAKVKRVMFVFVLELLNQEGHLAFFELQKVGRKANNAQKEKRRLARKRSRAAKREQERESAKAENLPLRQRTCLVCGRMFQSRKTAKRHKCAKHSKVVRDKGKTVAESSSHPAPHTELNKPVTRQAPVAPTAPPHSNVSPPVTGDLGDNSFYSRFIQLLPTGRHIEIIPISQAVALYDEVKKVGNIAKPGDEHDLPPPVRARYELLVERLEKEEKALDKEEGSSRKRRRR